MFSESHMRVHRDYPTRPALVPWLAVIFLFAFTAVIFPQISLAGVPGLDSVPASLSDPPRSTFLKDYAKIEKDWATLVLRAKDFMKECGQKDVLIGSSEDVSCATKEQILILQRQAIRDRIEDFSRRLKIARRNKARAWFPGPGQGILINPRTIRGDVKFFRKGQRVKNAKLMRVDRIITGKTGYFEISFDNGYVSRVPPNTVLELDFEKQGKESKFSIKKLWGKLRFYSLKLLPKEGRFQIRIGRRATCSIRNTDFIIRSQGSTTWVIAMIEGRIDVTPTETSKSMSLVAGQQLTLNERTGAVRVEQRSKQNILDGWAESLARP